MAVAVTLETQRGVAFPFADQGTFQPFDPAGERFTFDDQLTQPVGLAFEPVTFQLCLVQRSSQLVAVGFGHKVLRGASTFLVGGACWLVP